MDRQRRGNVMMEYNTHIVNAISSYYNFIGQADTYGNLTVEMLTSGRQEESLKYEALHEEMLDRAEVTLDYILANFNQDLDKASNTVQEHFIRLNEGK